MDAEREDGPVPAKSGHSVHQDDGSSTLSSALDAIEELAVELPDKALDDFNALPALLRETLEARLLLASLHVRRGDLLAARRVAQVAVSTLPERADAHHIFGEVLELLGEMDLARQHFLRTLELDERAFVERPLQERQRLLDDVALQLEAVVAALPGEFRLRITPVPLLVVPLPSQQQVEEGLDPRALGFFEGPDHADRHSPDVFAEPTRIVLFAENLAAAFPDPEEFKEQIRVTVLHEIGHYFGLDEDDMVRLGLD